MANKNKTIQSTIQVLQKNQQTNQNFDIDNWITDFENGFLDHLAKAINFDIKEGYHGLGSDGRPRINELNIEANAQQTEGYRVVEFLPDRDNKSESYLVFGTPLELQTQITLLYNIWKMLKQYGITSSDNSGNNRLSTPKNKPLQGVFITFYLSTKKAPPYYKPKPKNLKQDEAKKPVLPNKTDEYFSIKTVTIPVVNKSKVTYDNLRAICGGTAGQNWGLWSARAYVRSGIGLHQILCGGNTEKSAIDNLQKYLSITTAEPFRPITTRHDYNNKEVPKSFDLYPAYCKIENYQEIKFPEGSPISDNALNDLLKNRIIKKEKINLYHEKMPTYIESRIKDVLRIRNKDK
jgi:hypothetical protein